MRSSALNPEIAAQPDRADESSTSCAHPALGAGGGLVRANEEFAAWLIGRADACPSGPTASTSHSPLIDFDDLERNNLFVTEPVTYEGARRGALRPRPARERHPARHRRGEDAGAAGGHLGRRRDRDHTTTTRATSRGSSCRTSFSSPRRARSTASARSACRSSSGRPGAQTSTASSSKLSRGAGGGAPDAEARTSCSTSCAIFTAFATDKKHRKIKIICRYQQYYAANQIVERVVAGRIKKGLIWHFQGSGKSLLMVFAAQKLRSTRRCKTPTVLIVVDRIDLDTQITATFNAADVPNTVTADTRAELQHDARAGRAQGHHHDHPQVRRGAWRAQRARQHHRPGGRGAPHAGRRPRPQDARGAAERFPLRPHRHADQPPRPQHVLRRSAPRRTRRAT